MDIRGYFRNVIRWRDNRWPELKSEAQSVEEKYKVHDTWTDAYNVKVARVIELEARVARLEALVAQVTSLLDDETKNGER